MTKPARNEFKLMATLLLLVGVLVTGVGLVYLFLTPKVYLSAARIKVLKRVASQNQSAAKAPASYDPDLAIAECQVVRSNAFLDRAIQNLGLLQVWGKRYNQGVALKPDEARERLLSETDVHAITDSSVLAIEVTSEEPEETAKIANELARLYLDYRRTQPGDGFHGKIDSLRQQLNDQHRKLQESKDKLTRIASKIYTDHGIQVYTSNEYGKLQSNRIEMERQFVALNAELKELNAARPSELPQLLSSLDSKTNSELDIALRQRIQARNDLVAAESEHGENSPEVKSARLVVQDLDTKISAVVGTILNLKQADLDARKAALDKFDEDMKQTRLSGRPDPSLFQDATYVQAFHEFQQTKHDLDALEMLDSAYPDQALMPVIINAELMDEADVPMRPHAPDSRIALGIIGGGTLPALGGLVLLLAGQRRKRAPRTI